MRADGESALEGGELVSAVRFTEEQQDATASLKSGASRLNRDRGVLPQSRKPEPQRAS